MKNVTLLDQYYEHLFSFRKSYFDNEKISWTVEDLETWCRQWCNENDIISQDLVTLFCELGYSYRCVRNFECDLLEQLAVIKNINCD